MWAIIETGGKQYKVEKGQTITVEKITGEKNSKVKFDRTLLLSQDKEGKEMRIGTPYLEKTAVEGKIVESGKDKKVIVFKYKPKKRYRVKRGHRQEYTKVEITKV